MANTNLDNKYFFKLEETDEWQDISFVFQGLKVLKIDGFGERGDAINVYNEQWIGSQDEDFLITGSSGEIIRKNVDLNMTIIISRRYTEPFTFDEQMMYDNFVDTLLSKDFYLYSDYFGLQAHVVCNKSFKPTTTDLNRGNKSYILATIPLHCLGSQEPINNHCCCDNCNI